MQVSDKCIKSCLMNGTRYRILVFKGEGRRFSANSRKGTDSTFTPNFMKFIQEGSVLERATINHFSGVV